MYLRWALDLSPQRQTQLRTEEIIEKHNQVRQDVIR